MVKRLIVERTEREIIEGKLLTALQDKDTYAILLQKADIRMLVDVIYRGSRDLVRDGESALRAEAFLRDLMRFQEEIGL